MGNWEEKMEEEDAKWVGSFCKIEDYRVREGKSRVLGIGCYLLIKSCSTLFLLSVLI